MRALIFDNRFTNELPADPDKGLSRRQVENACFSWVEPTKVSQPSLLICAKEVADLVGLSQSDYQSEEFVDVFSGNKLLDGMQPYAMCYGGHQFGHWAGQLGDGRAINLAEVVNQHGEHWALQLKGAGATPYSRMADGLAVLRSSLREFICSEAMYHLGVPTTRALSLCLTGEKVPRDMMYNGNVQMELGAVVCRVAPSFIRFGSFQIFAARNQHEELKQLADFTIKHHFGHLLAEYETGSSALYGAWFNEICQRTLKMVIEWMRVGFVHGVMNTDNMSILGLTIDYGPYGWLDNFDLDWTPNTTDAQHRRYRFGQQGNVALWNCLQLANSLAPLLENTEFLEAALEQYQQDYQTQWLAMMASKLGLSQVQADDAALFDALEKLLGEVETDMTLFYRQLSSVERLDMDAIKPAYYSPEQHSQDYIRRMQAWLEQYQQRLNQDSQTVSQRQEAMRKVNPQYVFRNYLAQQAIDLCDQGDYSMLHELMSVLKKPYEDQEGKEKFAQLRPDWAKTKAGCSMLSCSS